MHSIEFIHFNWVYSLEFITFTWVHYIHLSSLHSLEFITFTCAHYIHLSSLHSLEFITFTWVQHSWSEWTQLNATGIEACMHLCKSISSHVWIILLQLKINVKLYSMNMTSYLLRTHCQKQIRLYVFALSCMTFWDRKHTSVNQITFTEGSIGNNFICLNQVTNVELPWEYVTLVSNNITE